jgi:hypothetical protein
MSTPEHPAAEPGLPVRVQGAMQTSGGHWRVAIVNNGTAE